METETETETTPAPGLLGRLYRLPADVLIGIVRLYQIFLSPIFGRSCRYEPTCSRYFIGAVRKYGAVSGSLRGIWRICRCHPFHRGGYDPP
ncbi:MAG TPA: membrane protein insertion efficiency factor YidD [Pirellulales bacterium]